MPVEVEIFRLLFPTSRKYKISLMYSSPGLVEHHTEILLTSSLNVERYWWYDMTLSKRS